MYWLHLRSFGTFKYGFGARQEGVEAPEWLSAELHDGGLLSMRDTILDWIENNRNSWTQLHLPAQLILKALTETWPCPY